MPIYEYECSHCRYYLEVIQKISDAALKRCPSCGKKTLKKLISAPVFRLKGSGWYETDFKSEQEQKRNLAAGEKEDAAAGAKGSPEGKDGAAEGKEAKPAAAEAGAEKGAEKKSASGEGKGAPAAAGDRAPEGRPAKAGRESKPAARGGSGGRGARARKAPPKRPAAAKSKRKARRGRR